MNHSPDVSHISLPSHRWLCSVPALTSPSAQLTDPTLTSSPQVLGHYLRRQRDPSSFLREIRAIASDPDERFFFNVTDEAALTDIVDALGDRIFGLEGNDHPGKMEA